jgi:hypothetical protein
LDLPRNRTNGKATVDFRHVIGSLVRKPGAFANYCHRAALYPSVTFRQAYDRMVGDYGRQAGTIEYLQLLKLAAEVSVEAVEEPLVDQLRVNHKWHASDLRDQLLGPVIKSVAITLPEPTLQSYDALLEEEVSDVG